jgi:4-diphosphocytidyl-2-C-methyl-D-erythritol kinase
MSISVSAPAKVNVVLKVGPLRTDGFHSVASLFHAVDLRDRVDLQSNCDGQGVSVSVSGVDAGAVPTDASNLAARAVLMVAEMGEVAPDVHVHIDKRIPVAGGMAGGSADAAAALLAADLLWNLGLSRTDLDDLAAQLGSDVPFALHGGTMLGLGRGEKLTPVLTAQDWHWVISASDAQLSTPAVYQEFDRQNIEKSVADPIIPAEAMAAMRAHDAAALGAAMHNDLQPAAVSLRPQLAKVLAAGREGGAVAGMVSGSGPTVFFLAESRDHAIDLAVFLSGSGETTRVHAVTGGVAGARVESPGVGAV